MMGAMLVHGSCWAGFANIFDQSIDHGHRLAVCSHLPVQNWKVMCLQILMLFRQTPLTAAGFRAYMRHQAVSARQGSEISGSRYH